MSRANDANVEKKKIRSKKKKDKEKLGRVTMTASQLGSLRNYDGDGNENATQQWA